MEKQKRKKVTIPHNVKERLRHQKIQSILEHVGKHVPKLPSSKKETKAKCLRRVVLYMKFLLQLSEGQVNPLAAEEPAVLIEAPSPKPKRTKKNPTNVKKSSLNLPVVPKINCRKAQIVFLKKFSSNGEEPSLNQATESERDFISNNARTISEPQSWTYSTQWAQNTSSIEAASTVARNCTEISGLFQENCPKNFSEPSVFEKNSVYGHSLDFCGGSNMADINGVSFGEICSSQANCSSEFYKEGTHESLQYSNACSLEKDFRGSSDMAVRSSVENACYNQANCSSEFSKERGLGSLAFEKMAGSLLYNNVCSLGPSGVEERNNMSVGKDVCSGQENQYSEFSKEQGIVLEKKVGSLQDNNVCSLENRVWDVAGRASMPVEDFCSSQGNKSSKMQNRAPEQMANTMKEIDSDIKETMKRISDEVHKRVSSSLEDCSLKFPESTVFEEHFENLPFSEACYNERNIDVDEAMLNCVSEDLILSIHEKGANDCITGKENLKSCSVDTSGKVGRKENLSSSSGNVLKLPLVNFDSSGKVLNVSNRKRTNSLENFHSRLSTSENLYSYFTEDNISEMLKNLTSGSKSAVSSTSTGLSAENFSSMSSSRENCTTKFKEDSKGFSSSVKNRVNNTLKPSIKMINDPLPFSHATFSFNGNENCSLKSFTFENNGVCKGRRNSYENCTISSKEDILNDDCLLNNSKNVVNNIAKVAARKMPSQTQPLRNQASPNTKPGWDLSPSKDKSNWMEICPKLEVLSPLMPSEQKSPSSEVFSSTPQSSSETVSNPFGHASSSELPSEDIFSSLLHKFYPNEDLDLFSSGEFTSSTEFISDETEESPEFLLANREVLQDIESFVSGENTANSMSYPFVPSMELLPEYYCMAPFLLNQDCAQNTDLGFFTDAPEGYELLDVQIKRELPDEELLPSEEVSHSFN